MNSIVGPSFKVVFVKKSTCWTRKKTLDAGRYPKSTCKQCTIQKITKSVANVFL